MVIQGVAYPSDFEAKKEMIELGRRMAEKGFLIADDGSLSVRVGPNAVWITAEGADKGTLKQDQFVRVDMNGKQMLSSRTNRLPEDLPIHLQVYQQNPVLRAVIHSYPAGAVLLACKGEGVHPADYTPSVRKLGRLTLVNAANVEEKAKRAVAVCKNDSGILFSGDGCVMWGESLSEAYHRLEALEYYAAIQKSLGPMSVRQEMRETAVSEKISCSTAFAGMDGLTDIIRPGDRKEEAQAFAVEVKPILVQKTLPEQKANQEQEALQKRDAMMAEVVRRSLMNL